MLEKFSHKQKIFTAILRYNEKNRNVSMYLVQFSD